MFDHELFFYIFSNHELYCMLVILVFGQLIDRVVVSRAAFEWFCKKLYVRIGRWWGVWRIRSGKGGKD